MITIVPHQSIACHFLPYITAAPGLEDLESKTFSWTTTTNFCVCTLQASPSSSKPIAHSCSDQPQKAAQSGYPSWDQQSGCSSWSAVTRAESRCPLWPCLRSWKDLWVEIITWLIEEHLRAGDLAKLSRLDGVFCLWRNLDQGFLDRRVMEMGHSTILQWSVLVAVIFWDSFTSMMHYHNCARGTNCLKCCQRSDGIEGSSTGITDHRGLCGKSVSLIERVER